MPGRNKNSHTNNKPKHKPQPHHRMQKPNNQPSAPKSSLGRSLLKTGGSILGGFLGGPVGSSIGSTASNYFADILGMGSYKINKNALMTNNGPPIFSGRDNTLTHREYVMDVTSSTSYNLLQTLLLNPANATTFPWLSQIAINFTEYQFEGLIFEFRATAGNAVSSTNNALGTVMMATDYNSGDSAPTDKRAMDVFKFATSSIPSNNSIHPIECDPNQRMFKRCLITAATSVSAIVGDPREYFVGLTYLATQGMQAASITLGELWVSYKVKLMQPRFQNFDIISPSSVSDDLNLHLSFTKTNAATSLTNPTVVLGYPLWSAPSIIYGKSSVIPDPQGPMPVSGNYIYFQKDVINLGTAPDAFTFTAPGVGLNNATDVILYNSDDNISSPVSTYNQISYVAVVSSVYYATVVTSFEFSYTTKGADVNGYAGFYISPTVSYTTSGSTTAGSYTDVRISYLGPANTAKSLNNLNVIKEQNKVINPPLELSQNVKNVKIKKIYNSNTNNDNQEFIIVVDDDESTGEEPPINGKIYGSSIRETPMLNIRSRSNK
jgi:hypothetical protein